METKKDNDIIMQGVKKGMDGLFVMDRNIEKPTLSKEDIAREKRKEEYEKERKKSNR